MKPHSKPGSPLRRSRGIKTIRQIGSEYGVHPVQVSDWKKILQERMAGVFERNAQAGAPEGFEKECAELQEMIGKLTVKVDFRTKDPNNPACERMCRVG